MVPFLSPVAGSIVTRQSTAASTSHQQSRGSQAAANLGGFGASYQFPTMGQSQIQGNLRDDIRFNQRYLRAMHDGAILGSGLGLGPQEAKSKRRRMK